MVRCAGKRTTGTEERTPVEWSLALQMRPNICALFLIKRGTVRSYETSYSHLNLKHTPQFALKLCQALKQLLIKRALTFTQTYELICNETLINAILNLFQNWEISRHSKITRVFLRCTRYEREIHISLWTSTVNWIPSGDLYMSGLIAPTNW